MPHQWERGVTVSPDSPVDKIPSDSLRAKLQNDALRGTGLENPPREAAIVAPTSLQLWLHRVFILLFVFLCAAMGVLLLILPWRPEWTDNHFLLGSPGLRAFVSNGFVRGLCSGLGLLDIWIGFWEAVHFRDGSQH
jgi:hypothetical protein